MFIRAYSKAVTEGTGDMVMMKDRGTEIQIISKQVISDIGVWYEENKTVICGGQDMCQERPSMWYLNEQHPGHENR